MSHAPVTGTEPDEWPLQDHVQDGGLFTDLLIDGAAESHEVSCRIPGCDWTTSLDGWMDAHDEHRKTCPPRPVTDPDSGYPGVSA